eukprot:6211970-Pleurochrysis_carterae.AAC.8
MLWQKKDLAVMSGETLAFVNYYVRTGYWRHMQHVCNEVLRKRSGSAEGLLLFWKAFGMLQEGAISDSIREFEALAARQDAQIALPVKIALVHAYQYAAALPI